MDGTFPSTRGGSELSLDVGRRPSLVSSWVEMEGGVVSEFEIDVAMAKTWVVADVGTSREEGTAKWFEKDKIEEKEVCRAS